MIRNVSSILIQRKVYVVSRMGEITCNILLIKPKGKNHLQDLEVDRKIVLKCILNK
jgi:hypothetical protein